MTKSRPHVFVEELVGSESRTSRLWPLSAAGDGLRRLVLLAGRLAGSQGAVMCIEDPEAYQHQSAIRQVAALLWQTSEANQILLSTHSVDLVHALIESVNGEPKSSQIAIYVLNREPSGATTVVRLSGAQAQAQRRDRQLRQVLGHRDLGGE